MKYVTYEQLAESLNVGPMYVRILKSKGVIKKAATKKIGRQVWIAASEIDRLRELGIGARRTGAPRAGTPKEPAVLKTLNQPLMKRPRGRPPGKKATVVGVELRASDVREAEPLPSPKSAFQPPSFSASDLGPIITDAFRAILADLRKDEHAGQMRTLQAELDALSGQVTQVIGQVRELQNVVQGLKQARYGQVIIRRPGDPQSGK